ncbi:MAG: squalene--hopene cyclase [Alphaproteobacteria bacterium]|nr:squalene--hopene cyclase [Alphaproteobacteria bacterium]
MQAPLDFGGGGDAGFDSLDRVIGEAMAGLKARQRADGQWCFDLEADATIPAEYIMLEHFLDEIDPELEARQAAYLRATQADHGGWPLYYGGECNVSATVKAYIALRMVGDSPDAPHMARAREAILAQGGAAKANVFTRIALALFGWLPWTAVPVMPVEMMLLPPWAPFHLSKVSYWSRTVIVPLLILMALKPRAKNPRSITIDELFVEPPTRIKAWITNPTGRYWGDFFVSLDKVLRVVEPRFPRRMRQRAIDKAMAWTKERLNGEDGLGGIFPAMANSVMAFAALGIPADDPDRAVAMRSVKKLMAVDAGNLFCQPCVSPVWDTVLAAQAVLEGEDQHAVRATPEITRAVDWLLSRQVLDVVGDWAHRRPGLRPGGWAFQDRNDYYPDTDDTAVAGMVLERSGLAARDPRVREALDRAAEWIIGMQSKDGGWAAFDADNFHTFLNHIPFADHGALLDPPSADVTARCISFLCQIGRDRRDPVVARGVEWLRRDQEDDGSWFGRWGTNYIYGTWSVLCALNAAGVPADDPAMRRAIAWLKQRQNADGGWGENGQTYWQERRDEPGASTASQTAWATMALMAAGEVDSEEVRRGIRFLLAAPRSGEEWNETWYTAVGFPRVFYLRYHGYRSYFPLWALARYRNLTRSNSRRPTTGM